MNKLVIINKNGNKLCTLLTKAERGSDQKIEERICEIIVCCLFLFAILMLIMVGMPMINIYILH